MKDVFVSYRRAESDWAHALVERLEAAELDVWIDHEDIPVSVDWAEEMEIGVADAAVFVVCDSASWRESPQCQVEHGLAVQSAKPLCTVTVGADLDEAGRTVERAVADLTSQQRARTELGALARAWDAAIPPRPRGGLVGAYRRQSLETSLRLLPVATPAERAFIRASKIRTRRRATVTVLAFVLTCAGLVTALVTNWRRDTITRRNDSEAASLTRGREQRLLANSQPFAGLNLAAQVSNSDQAVDAELIETALRTSVPDDAFNVPSNATGFTTPLIGDQVLVSDSRGRVWGRRADARDIRTSHQAHSPPAGPRHGHAGTLTVRLGRANGDVRVFRHGRLWRRLNVSAHVTAFSVSPDQRQLALALAGDLDVVSLDSGDVRSRMIGDVSLLRDVAWSVDGSRIWAVTGHRVVSWPSRDGTVIANRPGDSFEGALPAADPEEVWLITGSGELRLTAVSDGRVARTLRVPDTVRSAAADPRGQVAVVTGAKHVWIVPLVGDTRVPSRVPTTACNPGRAAVADTTTAYLPCINGPLLTLSLRAARVTSEDRGYPSGVRAARVLGDGTLTVSDALGGLWARHGDRVQPLFATTCGGAINRIAADPASRSLVPVGAGTGRVGCTRTGWRTGGDPARPGSWRFTALHLVGQSSRYGEAAAVSDDGQAVAIGMSDGTIAFTRADRRGPTAFNSSVVGQVRDMYVASRDQLVVVTSAGIAQRMPLCSACLTIKGQSDIAYARIQRTTVLGITRRVPHP